MKKVMTIFGAILFASAILTSCGGDSNKSDATKSKNISSKDKMMDLSGTYNLYKLEDSSVSTEIAAIMILTPFEDNRFVVRGQGQGQDWVGIGIIEDKKGFYDWRFDDGKTGQTTLTLNDDGTFIGKVLGHSNNPTNQGLDWAYKAVRK